MIKISEKIENVGPICRYWLAQYLDKVNSNPLGQELKSPAGTYCSPVSALQKPFSGYTEPLGQALKPADTKICCALAGNKEIEKARRIKLARALIT